MDDRRPHGAGTGGTVAVLLVSDVALLRELLAQALREAPAVRAVATTSAGDEAVARLRERRADVVVLDAGTGAYRDVLRVVADLAPEARVVAFGGAGAYDDDVLGCAEPGLDGYVARDASVAELVAAIVAASRGEFHCSPRLSGAMFRRLGELGAAYPAAAPRTTARRLTSREAEVLGCLERGLPNRAIAQGLGIAESTVKNHVHSVLEKLQLRRRAEAAAQAPRRVH